MNFLIELARFIYSRKKYWIVPVLIILLCIGGLLVITQGTSVAPFIYTIF
jgi:hypothetical protein